MSETMKFVTIFVVIALGLLSTGRSGGVEGDMTTVSSISSTSSAQGTTRLTPLTTFKPINFTEAKVDILENIKRQYNILKNLTLNFQKSFSNGTQNARMIYGELAEKVAWYFREPTENETAALDKSLTKFYPFGAEDTNDYLDTYEKMDVFCRTYEKHLDALRSWLRRKFKSLVVQLSFNSLITKIDKQMANYCQSAENKNEFARNVQKIKEANKKLIPARDALLDAVNFLKNSTYKLTKLGSVCCTFWDFVKQLNESVPDTKATGFAVNMTMSYFSPATNYLCVLFPYGANICKDEEKSPKSSHKYKSLIMELVLTLSDIVSSK